MLSARSERGSVLVLMPVGALVFIVLGALALDATVVFMAERELAGAAAAAANDAVTRAIDDERFYDDGCIVVLPSLAAEVVRDAVAAKRLGDGRLDVATPVVHVSDGARVTVTLDARAPHIFAKALPGGPASSAVSATATATAETSDGVLAGC